MGQPGTAAAPASRAPGGRMLPPSKEPGLWGTEPPRASGSYTMPSVLGFTPPAVEQEEALVAMYADACARLVDDTRRFPSVSRALARASEREVACVGARAYFFCLGRLWLDTSGKKDRANKVLAQVLRGYQQRLQQEVDKACMDIPQRPGLTALHRTVETAWMNSMNTK